MKAALPSGSACRADPRINSACNSEIYGAFTCFPNRPYWASRSFSESTAWGSGRLANASTASHRAGRGSSGDRTASINRSRPRRRLSGPRLKLNLQPRSDRRRPTRRENRAAGRMAGRVCPRVSDNASGIRPRNPRCESTHCACGLWNLYPQCGPIRCDRLRTRSMRPIRRALG